MNLSLDTLRTICDVLDECERVFKETKGNLNKCEPIIDRASQLAYRGPDYLRDEIGRAHDAITQEQDENAVCCTCGAPCTSCDGLAYDDPDIEIQNAIRAAARALSEAELQARDAMAVHA